MLDPALMSAVYSDLKRDEGRRDRPYRDTEGHLTIGYGHNLDAEGLCEAALQAQLEHDVGRALHDLDTMIPWWQFSHPKAKEVLINLGFNLGVVKLLNFKHTLDLIKSRNYVAAADALLDSLYARQVGTRAERLAALLRSI
jgi:lysozyme